MKSIRGFVSGPGQIALVVLKLTGVITWSWWWVMAPLWINALLLVLGLCALVLVARSEARKLMPSVMRDIILAGQWLIRLRLSDEESSGADG